MSHNDGIHCPCFGWVREYGVGLPGEVHHRNCKHWSREHKGAEVHTTKTELIVLGEPDENDESHNCDAMGCGTFSHVLFRFPLPAGAALSQAHSDGERALDLLDTLFTAYEDGFDVYEDPEECAGHMGHAVKLDDETFHACADLLNRTRPSGVALPDSATLVSLWFDEWELILPPDARESFRNDLLPSVRNAGVAPVEAPSTGNPALDAPVTVRRGLLLLAAALLSERMSCAEPECKLGNDDSTQRCYDELVAVTRGVPVVALDPSRPVCASPCMEGMRAQDGTWTGPCSCYPNAGVQEVPRG